MIVIVIISSVAAGAILGILIGSLCSISGRQSECERCMEMRRRAG
jgi:hypothetical protein